MAHMRMYFRCARYLNQKAKRRERKKKKKKNSHSVNLFDAVAGVHDLS